MKLKLLVLKGIFVQVVLLNALVLAAEPVNSVEIDLDHIEEQTFFFKTSDASKPPAPRKTALFDIKYLGKIRQPEGDPFFLVVARPCQEGSLNCTEDKNIYALLPSGTTSTTFVYPGKILDPKTKAVVHQSRMFFGQCIAGKGEELVTFQSEKVDRRSSMQNSVFVAHPENGALDEQLVMAHLPKLQNTLKQVKKKVCTEVEGRNRLMTSKTIILEKDDDPEDGVAVVK